MKSFLGSCAVKLIRLYQLVLSPALHALGGAGAGCRFEPTCSHYASESFRRFGFLRALGLTLRRLLRCQPFSRAGRFDPVPPVAECGNPVPQ